jgi:hypothetical protein
MASNVGSKYLNYGKADSAAGSLRRAQQNQRENWNQIISIA